jgi:lipopolysaccharide transport system permease protein
MDMKNQFGLMKSLRALAGYRQRVLEGIVQDVRLRYVGSLAGVAWAVLFPMLQLGIYAVLYGLIFKIRLPGLTGSGYVLLVFSGLVPLIAFNESLTAASNALVGNKNMLLNTAFPAELIPLRAALAAHVPGLAGLLITLAAGVLLGQTSWQAIFLIPLFWVLLLMFALGLGWVLSLLSLVTKDVQHILSLMLMMMYALSPFAYAPDMVPPALKLIVYLNPLSYFVFAFQQVICYGAWPSLMVLAGTIFLGLGGFATGLFLFQRLRSIYLDYA